MAIAFLKHLILVGAIGVGLVETGVKPFDTNTLEYISNLDPDADMERLEGDGYSKRMLA